MQLANDRCALAWCELTFKESLGRAVCEVQICFMKLRAIEVTRFPVAQLMNAHNLIVSLSHYHSFGFDTSNMFFLLIGAAVDCAHVHWNKYFQSFRFRYRDGFAVDRVAVENVCGASVVCKQFMALRCTRAACMRSLLPVIMYSAQRKCRIENLSALEIVLPSWSRLTHSEMHVRCCSEYVLCIIFDDFHSFSLSGSVRLSLCFCRPHQHFTGCCVGAAGAPKEDDRSQRGIERGKEAKVYAERESEWNKFWRRSTQRSTMRCATKSRVCVCMLCGSSTSVERGKCAAKIITRHCRNFGLVVNQYRNQLT